MPFAFTEPGVRRQNHSSLKFWAQEQHSEQFAEPGELEWQLVHRIAEAREQQLAAAIVAAFEATAKGINEEQVALELEHQQATGEIRWDELAQRLAEALAEHLGATVSSAGLGVLPQLRAQYEAAAFAEDPMSFWANNAVKGKKGFQPKPDKEVDLERVALPKGMQKSMEKFAPGLLAPRGGYDAHGNELFMKIPTKDLDGLVELQANRVGLTPRQLRAEAEAAVKGRLAKAELVVRAPPGAAVAILTEGRFKTQFEVGDSMGMFHPAARSFHENDMFGIPPNARATSRPVYGYLRAGPGAEDNGYARSYGRVAFVLKDSVRPRTTWTGGDSLDSKTAPSPINRPSLRSFITARPADPRNFEPTQPSAKGRSDWLYSEIQVHRGLRLSDVARIEIDGATPRLQSALSNAGFVQVGQVNSSASIASGVQVWERAQPAPPSVASGQATLGLAEPYQFDDAVAGAFESMSLIARHSAAERYLERNLPRLIRNISESSREAIRDLILKSFQEGIPPRDIARQIRSHVGLTSPQIRTLTQQAYKWRAKYGFYSARAEGLIARASAAGIRSRAYNIARTETLRAANAGQQAMWNAAADQGLLQREATLREWVATPSERTCFYCMQMDGQRVPLNAAFNSSEFGSVEYPPLHPSCRCATSLAFEPPKPPAAAPPQGLSQFILTDDPAVVAARSRVEELRKEYVAKNAIGRAKMNRQLNAAISEQERAVELARARIEGELAELTADAARPLLAAARAEKRRLIDQLAVMRDDPKIPYEATAELAQRLDFLRQVEPRIALPLPLRERVLPRPTAGGDLGEVYDITLNLTEAIEDMFGVRSRWSGAVKINPYDPSYAGRFTWDNEVHMTDLSVTSPNKHKTLLHEAFHGAQPLAPRDYMGVRGWEEGVVEMATQTFWRQLQERAGYGWAVPGYKTYERYTAALEEIRLALSRTPERFYGDLIRVPAPERAHLVEIWVEQLPAGLARNTAAAILREYRLELED